MSDRSRTVTVTTWYLEQTAPVDLAPAGTPAHAADIRIERSRTPAPEFSRFLYASVGAGVSWTDRLPWPYARWREFLERPGVETWVAYERGTPAGFIELDGATEQGVCEISYFGLLPHAQGRGLGGHLLTRGTERAWDLAERWEGRLPGVERVWLHTCSKDGPYARANYERRGFRVYRTEVSEKPHVPHPGVWPGAGPAEG
ncbi:GNAT family N-acetyltransferase [Streptomyces boncukensis]|uniref:GNAT family N-acetyltransferase n=1 Tax=Streptomyces boncukensis TaxID=2711219 RepID=A0A6G4WVF5_9ACTN|nr:GNAT family N-acetyltransferase [Streptomyces boncukensis]NGO68832.1 GNAT family N-acetyltransferase [Streptomyces boncukensis]